MTKNRKLIIVYLRHHVKIKLSKNVRVITNIYQI